VIDRHETAGVVRIVLLEIPVVEQFVAAQMRSMITAVWCRWCRHVNFGSGPCAVVADLNEVVEVGGTNADLVGAAVSVGNFDDVMGGQIGSLIGLIRSSIAEEKIAVLIRATGIVGEQIVNAEGEIAVVAHEILLGRTILQRRFISRRFTHSIPILNVGLKTIGMEVRRPSSPSAVHVKSTNEGYRPFTRSSDDAIRTRHTVAPRRQSPTPTRCDW